jgi:hypothetical protein
VRYVLTLESGRTIVAHSSDSKASHAEGATVAVDWNPADVWILPARD